MMTITLKLKAELCKKCTNLTVSEIKLVNLKIKPVDVYTDDQQVESTIIQQNSVDSEID